MTDTIHIKLSIEHQNCWKQLELKRTRKTAMRSHFFAVGMISKWHMTYAYFYSFYITNSLHRNCLPNEKYITNFVCKILFCSVYRQLCIVYKCLDIIQTLSKYWMINTYQSERVFVSVCASVH